MQRQTRDIVTCWFPKRLLLLAVGALIACLMDAARLGRLFHLYSSRSPVPVSMPPFARRISSLFSVTQAVARDKSRR